MPPPSPPPSPDVPRKTSGGSRVLLGLLGLGAAAGAYYYYYIITQPTIPPLIPPPGEAPVLRPLSAPAPPAPASVRDELLLREARLRRELEELRRLKRDKLVDMQKREIKNEIKTIQSGLRDIEKRSGKS